MSISFDNLPTEIKTYIIDLVDKPETTAFVSKEWYDLTDIIFLKILRNYEESPVLKSYAQRVKKLDLSNKDKVKRVYDSLLKKAKAFGTKQTDLTHMEEMAIEVQKKEAPHLIKFFNQLRLKEAQAFLDALPSKLLVLEKAREIKQWMESNQEVLKQVKYLTLRNITVLPEEISYLSELQELNLPRNKLTSLPESFGELLALQKLDLSDNQLTSLPESFGKLSALEMLDLSDNQLTLLPESFGQLSALQGLYLRCNKLIALPESFGQLSALQLLYLYENGLTTLPESFSGLSALQWLDVYGNRLIALPESFGELSALQWLYLSDNQLTTLPESFGELLALREIDLYDNELASLPESFVQLSALRMLYLDNKSLVPESIRNHLLI